MYRVGLQACPPRTAQGNLALDLSGPVPTRYLTYLMYLGKLLLRYVVSDDYERGSLASDHGRIPGFSSRLAFAGCGDVGSAACAGTAVKSLVTL